MTDFLGKGRSREHESPYPELHFSGHSFGDLLTYAENFAPEVGHRKPELLASAHELVRSYNVTHDFFGADDNAIGLLLAAGLHSEASRSDGKSAERQEKEWIMADNFARTLFGRYSASHPWEDLRRSSQLPDNERLTLHHEYTNHELTQRLHDWLLTSQEMQPLRQYLNVDVQLKDFNVMVLSMGSETHTVGLGASTDSPPGIDSYLRYLSDRAATFLQREQADPDDQLPYAYVGKLEGSEYLCIMEPTARVLLEPEAVGYEDDGTNLERIKGLMGHEFVHTQGSLELSDPSCEEESSYIGILLEEYRAEVLSGCHMRDPYSDIYLQIDYIHNTHGEINITELIRSLPAGGGHDKPMFYSTLIGQLGLNNTAKLAGLVPEDYAKFQSPKSSRVLHNLLGYGDIMDEIVIEMSDEQVRRHLDTLYLRQEGVTAQYRAEIRKWIEGIRRKARAS